MIMTRIGWPRIVSLGWNDNEDTTLSEGSGPYLATSQSDFFLSQYCFVLFWTLLQLSVKPSQPLHLIVCLFFLFKTFFFAGIWKMRPGHFPKSQISKISCSIHSEWAHIKSNGAESCRAGLCGMPLFFLWAGCWDSAQIDPPELFIHLGGVLCMVCVTVAWRATADSRSWLRSISSVQVPWAAQDLWALPAPLWSYTW